MVLVEARVPTEAEARVPTEAAACAVLGLALPCSVLPPAVLQAGG